MGSFLSPFLLALAACGDGDGSSTAKAPPQPGAWCGTVEYRYADLSPLVTRPAPLSFTVEGRQITAVRHAGDVTYLPTDAASPAPVSCTVALSSLDAGAIGSSGFTLALTSELGEATLRGRFPSPTTATGTLEPLRPAAAWTGCDGVAVAELGNAEATWTATPGSCDEPHPGAGGEGGTGGEAGAAGSGGTALDRVCAAELPRLDRSSPRISVGLPVTANAGVTGAEGAVDGNYHGSPVANLGEVSTDAPAWLAVDVGLGPERLLLVWADPGWSAYDDPAAGAPGDYLLETSADSTDGADGTWETAAVVVGNRVRSRTHDVPFVGQRWLRMTVTAPAVTATPVRLDELELFDVSSAGDERPQDTWLFMGDSIVDMSFDTPSASWAFSSLVQSAHPGYYPALVNAGIGGEFSSDGARHVAEWLELHPAVTHIAIQYGTNDAWGNKRVEATSYEANLRALIEAVVEAGRVPILARIPYASGGAHETLPEFNEVVDRLTEEYELPCGPDLYGWFAANPSELGDDGVHPAPRGQRSLHALWAEAVMGLYVDDE